MQGLSKALKLLLFDRAPEPASGKMDCCLKKALSSALTRPFSFDFDQDPAVALEKNQVHGVDPVVPTRPVATYLPLCLLSGLCLPRRLP